MYPATISNASVFVTEQNLLTNCLVYFKSLWRKCNTLWSQGPKLTSNRWRKGLIKQTTGMSSSPKLLSKRLIPNPGAEVLNLTQFWLSRNVFWESSTSIRVNNPAVSVKTDTRSSVPPRCIPVRHVERWSVGNYQPFFFFLFFFNFAKPAGVLKIGAAVKLPVISYLHFFFWHGLYGCKI